jgi:hypothetical protein
MYQYFPITWTWVSRNSIYIFIMAVLAIADVLTDLLAILKYSELHETNYLILSAVVFGASHLFNVFESYSMYQEKMEQMK